MPQLTTEARQRFLTIVTDCFAGRDATIEPDQMVVREGGAIFGLANLADEVALLPEEEWPSYIAEHFQAIREVPLGLPPYSQAKERLRIRLLSTDAAPFWERCGSLVRPVTDGLCKALVIAASYGARNVPSHAPAEWGVEPETLWGLAEERTIWDEPRERRLCIGPRGEKLVWVRGSFYVSGLLLGMGHLLLPRNRHGAVAMVPCRDALLYAEVRDSGVVESVMGMLRMGLDWYADGPGPVSPDLYWWRPGGISRLVEMDGTRFRPVWGSDFSEVLALLDQNSSRGGKQPRKAPVSQRRDNQG